MEINKLYYLEERNYVRNLVRIDNNVMIAANYSELRADLKKYLDQVEDNNEILIVKRKTGKGAVVISLEEYNSLMETVHLLKSQSNAERLYASINQLKEGRIIQPENEE